jgi:hypothetical protein
LPSDRRVPAGRPSYVSGGSLTTKSAVGIGLAAAAAAVLVMKVVKAK